MVRQEEEEEPPTVVVLLPIVTMHGQEEKRRKRRELSILRAGELATYIVRSYPAESSKSVSHATRVA
jgi:hypothetical protein